jgi:hypothetical protein
LIWDSAACRKNASALAILSLFKNRVMVFWLPGYGSNLVPIECFRCYWKELARGNKIEDMVKTAEKTLNEQDNPASTPRCHLSKNNGRLRSNTNQNRKNPIHPTIR